jgi:hypothetical protein
MIAQYHEDMSLNTADLQAIKRLIDDSIDERVPGIVDGQIQPLLERLEDRLTVKLDQLTLDVGQFSLETTNNFMIVNGRLDDLDGGLAKLAEMTDNNRVEIRKLKHKPDIN